MSTHCTQCQQPLQEDAQFCGVCGVAVDSYGDSPERFIDQLISNKYKVQNIIGVGNMGVVYLAEQLSLSKLVAIKVLRRSLIFDEEALQRFQFEARAASLLNHPNSINILDFGQLDDKSPFIVMEFVDGKDLSDVVEEEFPLPPTRIIKMMIQVCSALDEAHAAGLIHRDLKLANIMVGQRRTGEEFVKVLDFGIAKALDPSGGPSPMTRDGLICGTPAFMAPEQIRGKPLDPRTDIYALGVVLFILVTGRLPFQDQSSAGMAAKILTEKIPTPSKVRLDVKVHPAFDQIILKAMSRDIDLRYNSAQELSRALENAIAKVGRSSRPGSIEATPTAPPQPRRVPSGVPHPSNQPRHNFYPDMVTQVTPTNRLSLQQDAFDAHEAKSSDKKIKTISPGESTTIASVEDFAPPPDIESISRHGSTFALIGVILFVLLCSTAAYFALTHAPHTPTQEPSLEVLTESRTKAVGKADYHVKLGIVRAQEAAESSLAPDAQETSPTSPVAEVITSPTPDPVDDVPETKQPNTPTSKRLHRDKGKKNVKTKTPTAPPTETPDTVRDIPSPSPSEPLESQFSLGMKVSTSNPTQALNHFRAAIKQNPRHRAAWFQIYRLSVRLGQISQARRACGRVIAFSRAKDRSRLICDKFMQK